MTEKIQTNEKYIIRQAFIITMDNIKEIVKDKVVRYNNKDKKGNVHGKLIESKGNNLRVICQPLYISEINAFRTEAFASNFLQTLIDISNGNSEEILAKLRNPASGESLHLKKLLEDSKLAQNVNPLFVMHYIGHELKKRDALKASARESDSRI